MKKEYIKPSVSVNVFECEDVITTSGEELGNNKKHENNGKHYGWENGDNGKHYGWYN